MKLGLIIAFLLFISSHVLARPIAEQDKLKLVYGDQKKDVLKLSLLDYVLDFNDKKGTVDLVLLSSKESFLKHSTEYKGESLQIQVGKEVLASFKINQPLSADKLKISFPDQAQYLRFKEMTQPSH